MFAARMVFRTSTVPDALLDVPPPALAPLPATVPLSRRRTPSFQTAPPMPATVLLLARVALVRVVVPSFQNPAPLPPAALRLIVPLTTSSEPAFQRAPPSAAARLPSRATLMSSSSREPAREAKTNARPAVA